MKHLDSKLRQLALFVALTSFFPPQRPPSPLSRIRKQTTKATDGLLTTVTVTGSFMPIIVMLRFPAEQAVHGYSVLLSM